MPVRPAFNLRRRAATALAALLALTAPIAATTAHAASDRWTVTSLSGHVKVSRAGQWRELEPGMDVAVGAWVKTGTKGRVTLSRDGTSIEVKPRTQIAVAGRSRSPDKTVLMQRWGQTALDVDKRDAPHLEVHTPFLAAVVKGTTLDVNVGRRSSDIGVRSGSVSVRDDARGTSAEIGSGQSAAAGQGPRGSMRVRGARGAPKPAMRRTAPAPVLMAPIARSAPVDATTVDRPARAVLAGANLRGTVGEVRRARRAWDDTPSSDSDSGFGGLRRAISAAPSAPVATTNGPAVPAMTPPASPEGDWGGLLPSTVPGTPATPTATPAVPAATPAVTPVAAAPVSPTAPSAPASPASTPDDDDNDDDDDDDDDEDDDDEDEDEDEDDDDDD